MDIRNSLDGLRSLLGVNPTPAQAPQTQGRRGRGRKRVRHRQGDFEQRGQAKFRRAFSDDGVRTEKVAAIQAALAAGTYNVPASAVASKLVDAMLSGAA